MPRTPRQWVYLPSKPSTVPDSMKKQATTRADKIIETVFKPRYVKPPPKKARFNYIVDIYTKWHKNCLYFRARYASPGTNALSPFFEHSFTRLEYMRTGRFNLAYMRHTGRWWVVFEDLPMEEAFVTVRDQVLFHPPG